MSTNSATSDLESDESTDTEDSDPWWSDTRESEDSELWWSDDFESSEPCSSETTGSDSSDTAIEEQRSDLNPPVVGNVNIYVGAQVSYLEGLLLLLRFFLVHALTKRSFEDLLRLVGLFLPSEAKGSLPSSVYMLKRAFVKTFPHVPGRKISYCSTCHTLLDGRTTCGKRMCFGGIKEFVYISLAQQLKLKLEGECNCKYDSCSF